MSVRDVLAIDAHVLVPTVQAFWLGVHGGGGNGLLVSSSLLLSSLIHWVVLHTDVGW